MIGVGLALQHLGPRLTLLIFGPGAPEVVILTTFDLDDYVYEALRAGASGFLLKDAPRADLIRAVQAASAGEALLAPTVTRRLIETFARRSASVAPPPSRLQSLTPRERDIPIAAIDMTETGGHRANQGGCQGRGARHVTQALTQGQGAPMR